MKIGICHAHHIPLAHVELATTIATEGHEPVGIMIDHTPGLDDIIRIFELTPPPEARDFSSWCRDTGIVRNPALPKRPNNNGGSRYF